MDYHLESLEILSHVYVAADFQEMQGTTVFADMI